MIHLKRAYDAPSKQDGRRILVERLWPRGVTKSKAAIDLWLKDIAPSPDLRRWFNHEPEKWPEFQRRYREELKANPEPVAELRRLVREGPVTFVYAAKDEERNSAVLLKQFLTRSGSRGPGKTPGRGGQTARTSRRLASAGEAATAPRTASKPAGSSRAPRRPATRR
jgi:uncharacterized protein YeaO (DUF488 family)